MVIYCFLRLVSSSFFFPLTDFRRMQCARWITLASAVAVVAVAAAHVTASVSNAESVGIVLVIVATGYFALSVPSVKASGP